MARAPQNSRRQARPKLTLLGHQVKALAASPAAARLEAFPNPQLRRKYWIHFVCPEFTSLCPITGQPDFGIITIDYMPQRLCLESKSLELYLGDFRNYGTFHEAVVNRILDDVLRACRPRQARVTGKFNPRGGIAITVVAAHPAALRSADA
ncbi:MAG: NADPH-dependent 7-cyano-7-deazaguanine reductase QueF [Lentisphaerae bacterium]|nr:NADPH-dependent 7-cyano-7-deazaguanine reductase QueF [Lentisphaerota bacterium]